MKDRSSDGLKQRAASLLSSISSLRQELNPKETVRIVLTGVLKILVTAFVFYNSIYAAFLLSPYMILHFVKQLKRYGERKKWELNLGFCDMINCLSAALEAGYSVENAIFEVYGDMKLIYKEDKPIMKELNLMMNRLKNNMSAEEAFSMMAAKSGIDDIKSFADVFSTAKRTGGNIIAIIRSTAGVIRTKVELNRELRTVIASKKYESDIMKVIPFAILIYLRIFSPDMISSLYGNPGGVIFMTAVLILYVALGLWSDRIVAVKL